MKEGTLEVPDTWEVSMSACADKKAEWERMLGGNKLGAMALIRNLRNMGQAKVDPSLIKEALSKAKTGKMLPFRFIAAADTNPHLEDVLEEMMLKNLGDMDKLPGRTILLSDVSYSMQERVSARSDITRADAAGGLAIIARELCEEVKIFAFGNNLYAVPNRRGFALRDQVKARREGTNLGGAVDYLQTNEKYDRIIVFTDEQSRTTIPPALRGVKNYIVNVASSQNGVGYDSGWNHVSGWSTSVMRYISEFEALGES